MWQYAIRAIDKSLHMYSHQIVHVCHCVSMCGIACIDTSATHMFHVCLIELVANLYHTRYLTMWHLMIEQTDCTFWTVLRTVCTYNYSITLQLSATILQLHTYLTTLGATYLLTVMTYLHNTIVSFVLPMQNTINLP